MLTTVLTATGRHRRTLLATSLVAAVIYLAACAGSPSLHERTSDATGIVLFSTLGLALAVLFLPRRRAFDVRPKVPAFAAPSHAGTVVLTVGQIFLVTALTGNLTSDLRSEGLLRSQWPILVLAIVTALSVVSTWRGLGIELRPDGLVDRGAAGSLIIPWEALPVVPPPEQADKRAALPVRYGRPDLVRRRGLHTSRKWLRTDGINQQFAAEAIRYYVTHPEYRAAIGTQTEYNRLLTDLLDPSHG